jgi:hypothetical protein
MKAREIYRRLDGNYTWPRGHDNAGLKAQYEEEQAAIVASNILLEKLNSAFFKFAWKHRISEEEARFLLLNTGIKLPKPFLLVA